MGIRAKCVLFGCLSFLGACGGCDVGEDGDVDPSEIKAGDLTGYWYSKATNNVIAFLPPEQSREQMAGHLEMPDEPISSVYRAGNPELLFPPSYLQASTYSVEDGVIMERVIENADSFVNAPEGTEFRSKITSFKPGESLKWEGSAQLEYAPSCEELLAHQGVFTYAGLIDPLEPGNQICTDTFTAGLANIQIDAEGHVYSAARGGRAASGPSRCSSGWSVWRGGCDTLRYSFPSSTGFIMALDQLDGTLHTLQIVDKSQSQPMEPVWRIHDRQDPSMWRSIAVPTQTSIRPGYNVYMKSRGEVGYLFLDQTLFKREGEVVTAMELEELLSMPMEGMLTGFDLAKDGRLGILTTQEVFVQKSEGSSEFERMAFPGQIVSDRDKPRAARLLLGDEDVFVARGASVLRWNGAQWETQVAGVADFAQVALGPDDVPFVMHSIRGESVRTMTRMPPGEVASSFILPSGDQYKIPTDDEIPAMAMGQDGRIAYTSIGREIHTMYWDEMLSERPDRDVNITFEGGGSGRVTSDNGAIDCTQSCTTTVKAGEVVTLKSVADKGSLHLETRASSPLEKPLFRPLLSPTIADTSFATSFTAQSANLTAVIVPDSLEEVLTFGDYNLQPNDLILDVTASEDKIALVVQSNDASFVVQGQPLEAPQASPHNRYVIQGGEGAQWTMRPLGLDASIEFEGLALEQGVLRGYGSFSGQVEISGQTYGVPDAQAKTVVSFKIASDGQLSDVSAWSSAGGVAMQSAPSARSSAQAAFFVQGRVSGQDNEAGFLIAKDGAFRFHPFADTRPQLGGGVNIRHIAAHEGTVMMGHGEVLVIWKDGAVSQPVMLDGVIHALDPLTQAVIVQRASGEMVMHKVDAQGSSTSELALGLTRHLFFDAREESSYSIDQINIGMGSLRQKQYTPRLLDAPYQEFDPSVQHYAWRGELKIEPVRRLGQGKTWLSVRPTRGRITFELRNERIDATPLALVKATPLKRILESL